MPFYSFAQTETNSCAGVCVMVALAEFGIIKGSEVKQAKELEIYKKVQRGPNDVSSVDKVVSYFLNNKLVAQLLEDTWRIEGTIKSITKTNTLLGDGMKVVCEISMMAADAGLVRLAGFVL